MSSGLRITPILLMVVFAGCADATAPPPNAGLLPAVEGSITASGGELGSWTMPLTRCSRDTDGITLVGDSPSRWVRFGNEAMNQTGSPHIVDLVSAGGPYELIVRDDLPAPSSVPTVIGLQSTAIGLAPGASYPTCTVAKAYRFGGTGENPNSMRGGFRFDCQTQGGAHVTGRATYVCKRAS